MSKLLSKNRVPYTIGIAIFILIVAIGAIFYARGFKPDFKTGSIGRTGLIVASSIPTGAQVYLDDRLTSATDTNIAYLDPKKYKVKIQKDGYTTWEKEIEIRADLATEIKALLFPLAPEFKPQTTTGASSPTLSPDGGQIVYGVSGERGGVFVISMADRPFPFKQDVRQLVGNKGVIDYSKADFIWSPDSKQIIARQKDANGQVTANLLIDTTKTNQVPNDITASQNATLKTWQEEINTKAQTQALTAPQEVKDATQSAQTSSPSPSPKTKSASTVAAAAQVTITTPLNYYPTGLIFSPDEEKILYKSKDNKYQIFDLKDKKQYTLPDFENFVNISWFPDSEHLVVAQKDKISIIEKDGTNNVAVYSGKYESGFVFAHPSGNRLILLTTLTQPEGTPPNLYSINLR